MKLCNVQIQSKDGLTSVKIDGVEFGDKATKILFRHHGGEVPTVILEIPVEGMELRALCNAQMKKRPCQPTGTTAHSD